MRADKLQALPSGSIARSLSKSARTLNKQQTCTLHLSQVTGLDQSEVMYDGEVQSVLRCSLCNKPFDRPSTLKRHGYYCRSRRGNSSTVRSRSCISCAKAKARCDNKRPGCSRCAARTVKCHYPANALMPRRTGTGLRPQQIAPSLAVDSDAPPSTEGLLDACQNVDCRPDNRLIYSDHGFANLGLGLEVGGEYLSWDDLNLDFTDMLDPEKSMSPSINDNALQSPSLGLHSVPAQESLPSISHQPIVPQEQPTFSPNALLTIPPLPTTLPRLLIPRPVPRKGAQRTTKLIQHTLKSYLLTMLRHNALPPYIHPRLVASGIVNDGINTGPLSRCINLVRTISDEIRGSRALFWRNVRVECERLCAEHATLDKWELLGALQALSIYLLIRLDEGETEHNNLDFLLLAAVTFLTNGWDHVKDMQSDRGINNIWMDWTLEESRRRTGIIYRIINMLVYFEPAAMCDIPKDLALAPLPAKKQLWEAPDSATWKTETEREPGARTAFGLTATGELVKLEQVLEGAQAVILERHEDLLLHRSLDHEGMLRRSKVDWEEWCEGMDGFGGIVLLVASLVA
ncbi:Zn(II)2Cys6 transcription factor domain-containing protein [Aspergillus lucknowensis]|uniref:Zn(2)-C6 fungal-type domain-containing protein n=1 Tax=Aspergillus lucknowensis TaxID=176173 RepID=A0ABR4LVM5_9EURO